MYDNNPMSCNIYHQPNAEEKVAIVRHARELKRKVKEAGLRAKEEYESESSQR